MDKLYASNNLTGSLQQAAPAEARFISIDLHNNAPAGNYDAITEQTLKLSSPLENRWNLTLKRTFDIVISLVLIITVLSWLVPILALLIILDSRGPIFFLQERNGNGGKPFLCIKLRSMIVNDNAHLLAAQENDGRITKFGKFLRSHHLDELPQLFNVLIGDMSMVGPRPHMLNENLEHEKLITAYACRHMVKPGITGLAQSMGNFGATYDLQNLQERVQFDIQYIQTWSFRNDLKILLRTLQMVLGLK